MRKHEKGIREHGSRRKPMRRPKRCEPQPDIRAEEAKALETDLG